MTKMHAQELLDHTSPARYQASLRVTLVNIATNLFLTIAQVVIGLFGHSQALVADGMHTLSDTLADLLVLFALKHGQRGADAEHPYGHERIETAVTMILGIFLVVVGIGIAVRATLKLYAIDEDLPLPSQLTLWVAVGTLFAKEAMYRYTMRTATRFDSNMLRASAWHHRSDALSSLIVAVGIAGALMGFIYLDAIAAVIVAAMIIKVGVGLAWQSLRELVDTGLGPRETAAISRAIRTVNGVQALHLLRTRRVGGKALVDVHIIVDEKVSVSEGHQISESVRAKLLHEVADIADVLVHIDTEDDLQSASCAGLPLRDVVLARLQKYFGHIPEAERIEDTTLHYLSGHIDVELLLPLSVAESPDQARNLAEAFARAVHHDPQIGQVDVRFH